MKKLKTNKSALKRLKITGRGKILHRPVNQDHFNAKDNGATKRKKRKTKEISINKIRRLLPYNKK